MKNEIRYGFLPLCNLQLVLWRDSVHKQNHCRCKRILISSRAVVCSPSRCCGRACGHDGILWKWYFILSMRRTRPVCLMCSEQFHCYRCRTRRCSGGGVAVWLHRGPSEIAACTLQEAIMCYAHDSHNMLDRDGAKRCASRGIAKVAAAEFSPDRLVTFQQHKQFTRFHDRLWWWHARTGKVKWSHLSLHQIKLHVGNEDCMQDCWPCKQVW